MKTILVATDYTLPANNAVDYAAKLARQTGSELILFNVFKLSIHASNSLASSSNIEHLMEKNEHRLIELAKETEEKYEIEVCWGIGKDDTIESLKAYTLEHPVDLVVMGIESNLVEYKYFGNTTTAAIKLMQFPLLVVPNDVQFDGLKKIMYACEASYLKEDCKLGVLKDFINTCTSELEVFHVNASDADKENNTAFEEKMNGILHDVNHTFSYVTNSKVSDGIKTQLESSPSNLLVMVPHKLGFLESLFKGSQTNQMTVSTRVPLLVIPNEVAC